jgi:hypothetical protein
MRLNFLKHSFIAREFATIALLTLGATNAIQGCKQRSFNTNSEQSSSIVVPFVKTEKWVFSVSRHPSSIC